MPRKRTYDYIIIGAGIIGCAIARELSRYDASVLVIEQEADICTGASAANSAIIHAGHDPEPGTLKARLNVEGNELWRGLARDLAIPFIETGSYVIAHSEDEMPQLDALYARGIENGVPALAIIDGDEVRKMEPALASDVVGALWTPSAGIIDPFRATLHMAEHAVLNGVTIVLNTTFRSVIMKNGAVAGVRTTDGTFFCRRRVINCAGVHCDEVMHKAGIRPDFKTVPRKGEYIIFDAAAYELESVLFPLPTEKGKGILVFATTHGNILAGPNATFVDDKDDTATDTAGLEEVFEGAQTLIPSLKRGDIIAQFAGMRASGNDPAHDFIIEIPKHPSGFVNLGGIDSPGLTAAPAIAEYVAALLKEAGDELVERESWQPFLKKRKPFTELNTREKAALIAADPRYGTIVCRCEHVTEAEIVEALRGPVPAQTVDAVKRRTNAGLGRCQGGFCGPRIAAIIARELGIPLETVTKKSTHSSLFIGTTKSLLETEDDA